MNQFASKAASEVRKARERSGHFFEFIVDRLVRKAATYLHNIKRIYLNIMPSWFMTRLAGYVANLEINRYFLSFFLFFYSRFYGVNLDESRYRIEEFATFSEFFTRELRDGARPVNGTRDDLVSPVDGKVKAMGPLEGGVMLQAKDIQYRTEELIDDSGLAQMFDGGSYCTIYLAPGDYHRIHSPVDGILKKCIYLPGELFPVNDLSVSTIKGLFPKNHRVITLVESPEFGLVAIVKVAATIVGTVSLRYLGGASLGGAKKAEPPLPVTSVLRGDHIASFELGSTVILLFQKGKVDMVKELEGKRVKMGEIIGSAPGSAPKQAK